MSKRKRVSVCCGAPVIGEVWPQNPNRKYFTCSKCKLWPCEVKIVLEEGEKNGERNSGAKHKAI